MPNTFRDDVPQDVKIRRLNEVIKTFNTNANEKSKKEIGKVHLVLVENVSKLGNKCNILEITKIR